MLPRLFLAFAAAAACAQAGAATVVYSSAPDFLGEIASGYFLNTFTGPATPSAANAYAFSSGGFSYSICGAGGSCTGASGGPGSNTWINGNVISNNYAGWSLHISFDSGNVTALGGDFFGSPPVGGSFTPATMTITLSDGTSVTYAQATMADAFRGFISTAPIASLTLAGAAGRLNTIDNLIVGTAAVPEPGTDGLWLAGLLVVGAVAAKRKVGSRR